MGGGSAIRGGKEKPGDCPQGKALRDLLERVVAEPPPELAAPAGFKPAAVLVPLTSAGELLLTVRTTNLPSHAGQISFPGGRLEARESAEEAALREAWEEVRLSPDAVSTLGRLPAVLSPYGYHVTPVLAWLREKPVLTANPSEVSEIFWAPLAELAVASAWSEWREREGMRRKVWHYPWRGRDVWGLTANILHELLQRVCAEAKI